MQSDKTGADYTVLAADAAKTLLVGTHTYTLPQAGSAGFGAGFGICAVNVSAGDATISTTTSTFKGAGGGTSADPASPTPGPARRATARTGTRFTRRAPLGSAPTRRSSPMAAAAFRRVALRQHDAGGDHHRGADLRQMRHDRCQRQSHRRRERVRRRGRLRVDRRAISSTTTPGRLVGGSVGERHDRGDQHRGADLGALRADRRQRQPHRGGGRVRRRRRGRLGLQPDRRLGHDHDGGDVYRQRDDQRDLRRSKPDPGRYQRHGLGADLLGQRDAGCRNRLDLYADRQRQREYQSAGKRHGHLRHGDIDRDRCRGRADAGRCADGAMEHQQRGAPTIRANCRLKVA